MYLKNKGMYIEELINNTSSYYIENEIMYIEKRFLPIQPTKINDKDVTGVLLRKSTVDYLCSYKGKYIDFEVKQTDSDFFDIKKIKKHQINHLLRINRMGSYSFVLIYFFKKDIIKVVNVYELIKIIKNKNHKIHFNDNDFQTLDIVFPGIIDFKSYFDKELKIDGF